MVLPTVNRPLFERWLRSRSTFCLMPPMLSTSFTGKTVLNHLGNFCLLDNEVPSQTNGLLLKTNGLLLATNGLLLKTNGLLLV